MGRSHSEPQVLRPYHRLEAMTVLEGAEASGRTPRTVRGWCQSYDLGRRVGGRWALSRIALAMYLDGDGDALSAYLGGDRISPEVVAYFDRCSVPLPKRGAA